jgi:hypothetical protein
MSTDPCMDAAIAYVRPSFWRRLWNWYLRVTGYERAALQRSTGRKIRSTEYPEGRQS